MFYHCDVPTIILFDFLDCHASFNSFQTSRNIHPHSVPPIRTTSLAESYEESDIATVSYLSIFARTILSVPNILTDVLEALITSTGLCKVFGISSESSAADKTKAHQSLFAMLVRLMIEKFDSVAYCTAGAWRRKLW